MASKQRPLLARVYIFARSGRQEAQFVNHRAQLFGERGVGVLIYALTLAQFSHKTGDD